MHATTIPDADYHTTDLVQVDDLDGTWDGYTTTITHTRWDADVQDYAYTLDCGFGPDVEFYTDSLTLIRRAH